MRFNISAIFATALLGAIASADPKRGQQSTFRLERRHEHNHHNKIDHSHHKKIDHSHHRKSSRRQRRSLDDQRAAIVSAKTYDPRVENAHVASLGPVFNVDAIKETETEAEPEPKMSHRVFFDENGQPSGVHHDQAVAAADANYGYHKVIHHHHQQNHHKKVKQFAAQAHEHGKKAHGHGKNHSHHKNHVDHSHHQNQIDHSHHKFQVDHSHHMRAASIKKRSKRALANKQDLLKAPKVHRVKKASSKKSKKASRKNPKAIAQ
ncbi:MAG: hypothetical protein BYD32DRAFT_462830 [Podila humilis]|nr:MAG: hypothetical protein BYD32DRAFT_462830 [Podila humilis]